MLQVWFLSGHKDFFSLGHIIWSQQWVYRSSYPTVSGQNCVAENDRVDCYPFEGVTESICLAKGCIYCSSTTAPSCHLPPNYGYINDGPVLDIPGGYRVNLRRSTNISYVGGDADEISIFFYTEYNERLRIKVSENNRMFVFMFRCQESVLTDYRQHQSLWSAVGHQSSVANSYRQSTVQTWIFKRSSLLV